MEMDKSLALAILFCPSSRLEDSLFASGDLLGMELYNDDRFGTCDIEEVVDYLAATFALELVQGAQRFHWQLAPPVLPTVQEHQPCTRRSMSSKAKALPAPQAPQTSPPQDLYRRSLFVTAPSPTDADAMALPGWVPLPVALRGQGSTSQCGADIDAERISQTARAMAAPPASIDDSATTLDHSELASVLLSGVEMSLYERASTAPLQSTPCSTTTPTVLTTGETPLEWCGQRNTYSEDRAHAFSEARSSECAMESGGPVLMGDRYSSGERSSRKVQSMFGSTDINATDLLVCNRPSVTRSCLSDIDGADLQADFTCFADFAHEQGCHNEECSNMAAAMSQRVRRRLGSGYNNTAAGTATQAVMHLRMGVSSAQGTASVEAASERWPSKRPPSMASLRTTTSQRSNAPSPMTDGTDQSYLAHKLERKAKRKNGKLCTEKFQTCPSGVLVDPLSTGDGSEPAEYKESIGPMSLRFNRVRTPSSGSSHSGGGRSGTPQRLFQSCPASVNAINASISVGDSVEPERCSIPPRPWHTMFAIREESSEDETATNSQCGTCRGSRRSELDELHEACLFEVDL